MVFHVRITKKSDKTEDEIWLDLTKEKLQERILNPYYEGNPIIISGKSIPIEDLIETA